MYRDLAIGTMFPEETLMWACGVLAPAEAIIHRRVIARVGSPRESEVVSC